MFKYRSSNFLPTILILGLFLVNQSSAFAQDARLIARNVFPSVVMLEMRDDQNRPIALGSGFFVRRDVIATNYHVIEGASDGSAKIVGQKTLYKIEGVVGTDKKNDLALIKLKGANGKPLVLADVSKIEVGQEIFALGNPKGLEGTISTGIISGSSFREVGNESLIQITTPISPGSSGGPIVNRKGEVIGIAVGSLKEGQSLNFAIPSAYLGLLLVSANGTTPLSGASDSQIKSSRPTSDPSLAETTTWISEQLVGKIGSEKNESIIQRNERLVFDNCSMIVVHSIKDQVSSTYFTYFSKLDKLENVAIDQKMRVVLKFSGSAIQYKQEDFRDGRLIESKFSTASGFYLWVGDALNGERVVKAFNHAAKLCKERTASEPF